MRIIPTQIPGVLEYVTGGTLLSAPGLLGLGDVPASARVHRLAGGAFPHGLVGATEMLAAARTKTR
jgi:hypothetical protein